LIWVTGCTAALGWWAVPLLLTVVTILTVAFLGGMWLLRQPSEDTHWTATDGDPARDRLRQRYANGEIDDEEYERRLTGLTWR
jgi:putative membrane protein